MSSHIEDARAELERQLEERTRELSEALAQQAATSDVLGVISRSFTSEQPVFDAIVESCARLIPQSRVSLWLAQGELLKRRARAGQLPLTMASTLDEAPLDRTGLTPTSVLDAVVVHVPDVQAAVNRFPRLAVYAAAQGYGSQIAAPLIRAGIGIGAVVVLRKAKGAFSEREIALVKTFADQAVIAIENARMFNEIREQSRQLESQARELAVWNCTLETRVSEGIAELERAQRLRRFLPPQVADMIVAEGGDERLRHHRREIVVVFLDLRGFTAFTETSDPEEVVGVLNQYHAAMGTLIQEHGGTLNSYAGDGIMAFFNDPVEMPDAPARAARMAVEMQAAFAGIERGWVARGYSLKLGIGIAQGFATLGTIGFEGRWDYGAVGTVCNLAARLCAEAKGGEILSSQRIVAALAGAFSTELLGELTLKGFARPVPAFRILDSAIASAGTSR